MNESELLQQLDDLDWEVRKAAVERPNATEQVLLVALEDEKPDARLATVNNTNATEPIFKRAAHDKDERVRKAVALAHLHGSGVVSRAVAGLETGSLPPSCTSGPSLASPARVPW
jgi:hypothetical protein